jgi:hypothetical protein
LPPTTTTTTLPPTTTTTTTTTTIAPCGVKFFFTNNSGPPAPISEAWSYIGCDGESYYIYATRGQTVTACVLIGTFPSIGSYGDNPYTDVEDWYCYG